MNRSATFVVVGVLALATLRCSSEFTATGYAGAPTVSGTSGSDSAASGTSQGTSGGSSEDSAGAAATSGVGSVSGHGGANSAGVAGAFGDAGAAGEGQTPCDPTKSPSEELCLVSNDYAIFVAPSGRDGAAGTKAEPVKTIAKALELADERKIVVVCDGTYDEKLKLTASAKLYGGFACPGTATPWSYETGNRAKIAPSTRGIALSIASDDSPVIVEDFEFSVKDGADAGESSIAAFVKTSTQVEITRVKLLAGKGADGASGAGISTPAASGAAGSNGSAACFVSSGPNVGGAAVQSSCGGLTSEGGKGGDGGIDDHSASNGELGLPLPQPDTGLGWPGIGQTLQTWDCSAGPGRDGGGGRVGSRGASAPDAMGGIGAGNLSIIGYTPASGANGLDGAPGQGGGGGGGAQAPTTCGANPRTGASGGSGGGGGCGGKGGGGGTGGGASIALASVNSSVALDQVDLVASGGGKGGNGGAKQTGGSGGDAGKGASGVDANDSCDGGKGGKGGNGGNGGGGAGGPSIGIAFVGTQPTQKMVSTTLASTPATGGADGTGALTGPGAGSAGVVASIKEF